MWNFQLNWLRYYPHTEGLERIATWSDDVIAYLKSQHNPASVGRLLIREARGIK